MSMTLGYWSIRGLCHPIRLLLKYVGADYREETYHQGDAPEYSRDEWLSVKYTLGLDFPNLPYLIDGDLKLTQSNAILAYLGRKYKLCGQTEAERATISMLVQVIFDFKIGLAMICYNPAATAESLKPEYLTKIPETLKTFSDFLGDKDWLMGSQITYPDFFLYEVLKEHTMLEPTILDKNENLKNYVERFEGLPGITEYVASPESQIPINMKYASWGNK